MFKKLKAFVLLTLIAAPNFSYAEVTAKYDEEEATWRYTELDYRGLDHLFKLNYCGKEEIRYLGCIAALEQIAQVVNEKNILTLENGILTVRPMGNTSDLKTAREVKSYHLAERKRFQAFSASYNPLNAASIENIYLGLKAQIPKIEPYQVARAYNAAENIVYDIHTRYEPKLRYNGARVSSKNSIVGVRYVREGDLLMVQSVVKGLPAEQAGIKSGDKIISIDGQLLKNVDDDAIDLLMTKEIGEAVKMELVREKQKNFNVSLEFVRAEIPKLVERNIRINSKMYAYINFENFMNPDLCEAVKPALKRAQANAAGLVLDLRWNPGGYTDQAGCILGALVGPKVILMHGKNIIDQRVYTELTKTQKIFSKPLVVLVNHRSTSAAELLSGNIKLRGRGLLVGTTTFGKGTEQVSSEIDRLTRYETAFIYYFANGQSPQLVGVQPDIQSYVNPEALSFEETTVREADIGLRPFVAEVLKTTYKAPAAAVVPESCIQKKNVLDQFAKLELTDWKKDMQLLNGLAALECTK